MIFTKIIFPASVYLFKVSNANTGMRSEVNNKDTRTTLNFTPCSSISVVHFKQVNAGSDYIKRPYMLFSKSGLR